MIRIGVVGYGYWGPNLARCFSETDGCQLKAIADPSSDALGRARKRYPSAELFTDWRSIVSHPGIDGLAIATPVQSHHEIASAALAAGKSIFVEKPITETSGQAENLVEMAARRNLVLMVDHTFIYTPAVQKIQDLVNEGELGEIYYYDSTRVNLGLFQGDVNVIWDLAVHDLSILQFILAEHPLAVSANGVNHVFESPENMAHVSLYFSSGVHAHVSVNWLAPVKVRQTLIGGSRKMVIYDDVEPSEKIKVYDRGIMVSRNEDDIRNMRVSYRIGDMWAPQLSTKEALLTATEHFIGCVRNGTRPQTDGLMGLRVVETLEAATQSMRQRGRPVELTPMRRVS
jgi:predicted dehydrogenase